MIVHEDNAGNHACPFRNFEPCLGAKCMAFSYIGRDIDQCDTDNLGETGDGPRPIGDVKSPEGDGWEADGPAFKKSYHRSAKNGLPAATGQRWIRKRHRSNGTCARVAEQYDPRW